MDFLVGLLTRHLGTKVLALLLSVGLFTFVQFSQSGVSEIETLELDFRLDEEMAREYVLLTPAITLQGLKLQGLRSKLEPLAQQMNRTQRFDPEPLTIDKNFPRRSDNGLTIPINRRFLNHEKLFGKEIEILEMPSGLAVQLDRLEVRSGVPVVTNPNANLVLPPEHPYQGTGPDGRLEMTLNVRQVEIRGPATAMLDKLEILVDFPGLGADLAELTIAEPYTATVGNVAVLWQSSGIAPDLIEHIRIVDRAAGVMTAEEFASSLTAECVVIPKKLKREISVPIVVLVRYKPDPDGGLVPEYNLPEDWRTLGGLVKLNAMDEQRVDQLPIRLPKKLADNEAFLQSLVLVLDTNAAESLDANRLNVPVYLDVKDRTNRTFVDLLRQVEIVDETGKSIVVFQKKDKE